VRFAWALFILSAGLAACGGGGGSSAPPPVIPPADTVTVYYLRAQPEYDGWGLHLWGSALDATVTTTWASPRPFDRVANGAAVFEVPVSNRSGEFNFIAHNGDLKSPVYDMSITPSAFGSSVWLVQDEVASLNGNIGLPFNNEADALAALNALGNKSIALDLSTVVVNDIDSGLPVNWTDYAGFVEIYVRGYMDSDGDGIGDIQGLISRLDYLQSLGVKGLWLMPVMESADNDHGYAVEDYRDIEDDYGTLADFDQLVTQAHARGIAIIIDYVMNHAASTNPLFLDATTTESNARRDWFIWEDTKPMGWNTFAGDPWRNNGNGWYYGVFSALMPDWNLRNQDVVDYHKDNLRFWLNRGVDGFRFDAVGVLVENGASDWENQPENHSLLEEVRLLLGQYSKRYLVCEAPSDTSAYAVDASCGRAFAFPASASILDSARSGIVSAGLISQLTLPNIDRMPLFLSNHDSFAGARPWNQLSGDITRYKLAAATYILAARTPFAYYGEELGMANAATLGGDHALRTPMSWTADPNNAGFSTVPPFRELSANSTTNNVALQEPDTNSLLNYYAALYSVRNNYPVIGTGSLDVQSGAGQPVLLFARADATDAAVVAINFSNQVQAVTAMTPFANEVFDGVFGATDSPVSNGAGDLLVSVPAESAVIYYASP
jgi:glycosidase